VSGHVCHVLGVSVCEWPCMSRVRGIGLASVSTIVLLDFRTVQY
jgi:hypothetical protein